MDKIEILCLHVEILPKDRGENGIFGVVMFQTPRSFLFIIDSVKSSWIKRVFYTPKWADGCV